jgi:hypothetical protein
MKKQVKTVNPSTMPVLLKLAIGIVSEPMTIFVGSMITVVVPDVPVGIAVLEPDWGTTIVEPSRTSVVDWAIG